MQFQDVLNKFKTVKYFDPQGLIQLKDDTDEEVAIKILARFFITLEESLDVVSAGLNSGDRQEISKGSHKIAGSADLVGFNAFAEQSRKISYDSRPSSMLSFSEIEREIIDYIKDGKTVLQHMKTTFSDYKNYI